MPAPTMRTSKSGSDMLPPYRFFSGVGKVNTVFWSVQEFAVVVQLDRLFATRHRRKTTKG
jgi:hypothetical protein